MEMVLANPLQDFANPPLNPRKSWFNPSNARLYAEQSKLKRQQMREQAKADAEKVKLVTPQSIVLTRQLARIEQMMDKTTEPAELSTLANAHSKLFNAWQVLTSTPNPGSRRAKSVRSSPILEPVPIQSSPEPAPVTPQAKPADSYWNGY